MSVPCVRIELTYADGSYQVAEGDQAQAIVDFLDGCQHLAIGHLTPHEAPQFTFFSFSRDTLPDSESALRGDRESGL
jgi:hypothetical protein